MYHSVLGAKTDYNNDFHWNFNAKFKKASFLPVYPKIANPTALNIY